MQESTLVVAAKAPGGTGRNKVVVAHVVACCGGGAGVVTVWNLEDRRLHAVLPEAHDASLVALHFFAGEPLLMSAGADNALKHWVFEGQGGEPRLLRFRSGHAAPPSVVMHYGEVRGCGVWVVGCGVWGVRHGRGRNRQGARRLRAARLSRLSQ